MNFQTSLKMEGNCQTKFLTEIDIEKYRSVKDIGHFACERDFFAFRSHTFSLKVLGYSKVSYKYETVL